MKIVKLTAAVVILASCNQATETSNTLKWVPDTKAENLKGNVEQIVTETYFIDSATSQKGKLESKTVETYNNDGYVLTYSKFTAADSSTLLTTYEAIDANGHYAGYTSTKNSKPFSTMKFDIDSAGRLVAATSTDSTGKTDSYYTSIKVNDFGQAVSGKQLNADSSLKLIFAGTYDSIYITKAENKDSAGKTISLTTVQYDDKRNITKMDAATTVKDSTTNTSTTYVFDKFDDKGNWVQQTTNENGKPKEIAIRTIMYKQ